MFRFLHREKPTPVAPPPAATLVALVESDADRQLISRVQSAHNWNVHFALGLGDAWEALNGRSTPILLCQRDYTGTNWRDVIRTASRTIKPSYTVLASRVVDDYLWNELIRWGGHDLVTQPLRAEDLLRAVRLANTYWASLARPAM